MTPLDISFQAIFQSIISILPSIFTWIFFVFLLWLSLLIGMAYANSIWKNNIKHHMEQVAKDEIDSRDKKIIELEKIIEDLKTKNKIMYGKLYRIKNIMNNEVKE